MNKLIIFITLTLLNITVSAQKELAKDILERLSSKTESCDNITIKFIFLFAAIVSPEWFSFFIITIPFLWILRENRNDLKQPP